MAVSQSDCKIRLIRGQAQDPGQSGGYARIDILPDDVLLDIFDAHRIHEFGFSDCSGWQWDRLVHVCRRWRQIIFASPLRLCIHLHCTDGIDVKKFLGCWLAFPITVTYYRHKGIGPEDNVLAVLEHSDRVHHFYLRIREKQLAKLATVIQKPFPMLTKLRLSRKKWPELVLPRGFLGGSAPHLQELYLENILFPELPKFLLSTRDLVTLRLSGKLLEDISPKTMVTCLAPLTRLTSLSIQFFQYHMPSDQLGPAPVIRTRTVLPALTSIDLDCGIHYMEDLVARIDCPRLNSLDLYPWGSSVDLQVSQIYKFVNRSEDPLLTSFDWVDMNISSGHIGLRASHKHPPHIGIFISLIGENWRLSHIFQVFNEFSPMLSNVRHLSVDCSRILARIPTNSDWSQLLVAFSALQTVMLYGDHALEYINGEMAAGLLPDLDLLCIKGWPVSVVDKFCAARRASGHLVTVVNTYTEFYEIQKSYIHMQEK